MPDGEGYLPTSVQYDVFSTLLLAHFLSLLILMTILMTTAPIMSKVIMNVDTDISYI